ncbi:hypothetical protein BDV12DRAFT_188617 [Aspergillus spectabilis]
MPPFPSPTQTRHDTTYPSISPTCPKLSVTEKIIIVARGGTDTNAAIEHDYPGTEAFATSTDITKKNESNTGLHFSAQAFFRHTSADAVAITVSSAAALLNFAPGFASYSVSKLAIIRLWDSFSFANPGLSVFHIQPGAADTGMNKEAGGVAAFGLEDRVSLPANLSVWFASPKARSLKGKYLWANWDVNELRARAAELEASTELTIGLIGWPFVNVN